MNNNIIKYKVNKIIIEVLLCTGFILFPMCASARSWTLKDCIEYAITNNITIQKKSLAKLSAREDIKLSQAELLPSLSLSTSQNLTYNPWPQTGSFVVAGDKVQTSVDKTYYNGSYGVNANWTVWNGNRNRNQIKLNKVSEQQTELDSAVTANSLMEQIAQLYVQILYSNEAVNVNNETLATSKKNEERGIMMMKVGKMSKADLAQLTAQRAKDEYAIIESESNLKNYKRQLKQLLQITNNEDFDITIPETTDEMALENIPTINDVYDLALNRPEIKGAQLGIQGSDISIKIAKAQKLPTVSMNAGFNTNTTSMNSNAWDKQIKNNFALGGGFTVSVPIFDNRQAKTAINKARIQRENYMLDLKDKQTSLYSTIENYWLQANNNQSLFKSAKVSTQSSKESYELLSEQFNLGLKNIIELMTGKDNLLRAQQNELQSKYLTILNIDMLKFYMNGDIK
ncbi:transporter [Prevotella herbatica]|uniref:Transporter n=2 Tax=Prevotella TaxID=838 RepID=A0ABN6EL74_9BACT|nr:transporter [Prevotella herbatica]